MLEAALLALKALPLGRIARLAGIGIGAFLVAFVVRDYFAQRRTVHSLHQCERAMGDGAYVASLEPCTAILRPWLDTARRARICDAAIALPDRDRALFAIRASCSDPVKREVAAHAVADANASRVG